MVTNGKIVITGGAGFIGSHVARLFCDRGYNVFVVDDLSFGFEKFVDPRATFIKSRIQDQNILDKVLEDAQAVIHLAASSIIKFSFENPFAYVENNIAGGVKLLESMRRKGVKKIVFSSSASVYGSAKKIPISEDSKNHPETLYGATKLSFEYILESYYHSFGIDSVSLRYFNAYGPYDEQIPATRAVPIWIRAILTGKPAPLYWEGKQERDYVYVEDVAQAHMKALDLAGVHVINIGSGRGIKMKKLLEEIEKVVGVKAKIDNRGERLGDPLKLVADISRAREILQWIPKTNLTEGLQKTIDYYRSVLI